VQASVILDALLIFVLIGYTIFGVSQGVSRSHLIIFGIASGVVAAVLITPVLSAVIVFDPSARVIAAIAMSIVLIAAGHTIGFCTYKSLNAKNLRKKVGIVDRIAGGLAFGILIALVLSTNSLNIGKLGAPSLSSAFADSKVIQTLHYLTPDGVELQILRLRALLTEDRDDGEAFYAVGEDGAPEGLAPKKPTLPNASASVVRITGNAYACGQAKSGTGFVIAPGRVITNAHVVAGISQPVIRTLDGQVIVGSVVYFDSRDDLAVIAVDGIVASPINKGTAAQDGDSTEVVGYPYGGPIDAKQSQVQSTEIFNTPDIYGQGSSPRQIYVLEAEIEPGDSGSPLLDAVGNFVGIVFGRATDQENIGYAMTLTELAPLLESISQFQVPVSTGECRSSR
jgi:S1-C subfamily serine protease